MRLLSGDDLIHKGEIAFFNYGNADFVDLPVTTTTVPRDIVSLIAPL
jgi:hypothetical protein